MSYPGPLLMIYWEESVVIFWHPLSYFGLLFDECRAFPVPCCIVVVSPIFLACGTIEFILCGFAVFSHMVSCAVGADFACFACRCCVPCSCDLAFEAPLWVFFKFPGFLSCSFYQDPMLDQVVCFMSGIHC